MLEPRPAERGAAEPGAAPALLIDLLLRAAQLLRTLSAPHLTETGLNDARLGMLREIQAHGPGGCSQTDLARELLQSEANVSTLLDRMRQDGLIVRRRSPADRRKSQIRLTAFAGELLTRINADRPQQAAQLLTELTVPEQNGLADLLQRLVAQWTPLAQATAEPTPGPQVPTQEVPHARAG